jgi:hypothetical protein
MLGIGVGGSRGAARRENGAAAREREGERVERVRSRGAAGFWGAALMAY